MSKRKAKGAPAINPDAPRVDQRAARLVQAATELRERMDANPKSPRMAHWQKRLDEYEKSITNLQSGLHETTGLVPRPGVDITVPVHVFKKKG